MIEINNLTNFAVDKKFLTRVAKIVLKGENKERENISVAFIGKEEIKNLNKKYRKINKATDVLSFSQNSKVKNQKSPEHYWGEIIICPEVVKENSKKYGVDFKREVAEVFVHGILHLCGYDHKRSEKDAIKMEKKEEYYLRRFF